MEKIRSGFSSYLSSGEYTPEFIDDVNMIISKAYDQWKLHDDKDEFSSSCWVKVVNSLRIYEDGGALVGPLSTFLFQVIFNEARRIYSKHKKVVFESSDDFPEAAPVWASPSKSYDSDLLLRDKICTFSKMAYSMGVYVNQKFLYRNYLLGNMTPAVKSFMWGSILSNSD